MHQLRFTKSLGFTPPVLRGFDVSGLHLTEAEYDDRVPDGEITGASSPGVCPTSEPLRMQLREIVLSKGFPKPLEGVLEDMARRSGSLPEFAMLTGASSSLIPLVGEDPPVDDLSILGDEAPVERLAEMATEAM
jgi:hypothetical protein